MMAVGLAELGDKTQLSVLFLSTRTRRHLHLLLGVILAFLVVDGVAILAGEWVASVVPENLIKILSAIVFIIFGVLILRRSQDTPAETEKNYFKNPFYSGFVLIFLTEWGDKTQIASGLFAIRYNPLMVLLGVMAALTLLTIIAIFLGRFVSNKIRDNVLRKISGIVFILIGISFLLF